VKIYKLLIRNLSGENYTSPVSGQLTAKHGSLAAAVDTADTRLINSHAQCFMNNSEKNNSAVGTYYVKRCA